MLPRGIGITRDIASLKTTAIDETEHVVRQVVGRLSDKIQTQVALPASLAIFINWSRKVGILVTRRADRNSCASSSTVAE